MNGVMTVCCAVHLQYLYCTTCRGEASLASVQYVGNVEDISIVYMQWLHTSLYGSLASCIFGHRAVLVLLLPVI